MGTKLKCDNEVHGELLGRLNNMEKCDNCLHGHNQFWLGNVSSLVPVLILISYDNEPVIHYHVSQKIR